MPGRAERVRRARRLAVVTACLTLALVVVLLSPAGRWLVHGTAAPNAPTSTVPPSSTAATPTPNEREVGVSQCGASVPEVRPEQLRLRCASAAPGLTVSEVVWGSWGRLNALGSALVVTNDCEPTCATGHDQSYAATVVLDRVETNRVGPQFTRATVIWSAGAPTRFHGSSQVGLPLYRG